MFCGQCGNKNEVGTKFCGKCGAVVETPGGASPIDVIPGGDKPLGTVEVGPIKIVATDKDTGAISIAGKTFSTNFFFKLMGLLLAIAFFLPMFSIQVRIFGMSAGSSFNGWGAAFGEGSSIIAIFLLLLPVAVFVMFQFKKQLDINVSFIKGRRFTLAIATFALGFILLLALRNSLGNNFGGNIGVSAGFVISVILYLLSGVIALGCFLSAKGSSIKMAQTASVAVKPTNVTASAPEKAPKPVTPYTPLPMAFKGAFVGLSVLLLVSFFLNWVSMDFGGSAASGIFSALGVAVDVPTVGFTGFNIAFGYGDRWDGIEGMGVAIPLLIIPILIIGFALLQDILKLKSKMLLVLLTLTYILGIVLMGVVFYELMDEFHPIMESIAVGFILSGVLYVLGVIAAVLCFVKLKNN